MSALHQWFAMGGYAYYVWSSYVAFISSVVGFIGYIRHQERTVCAQIKADHASSS